MSADGNIVFLQDIRGVIADLMIGTFVAQQFLRLVEFSLRKAPGARPQGGIKTEANDGYKHGTMVLTGQILCEHGEEPVNKIDLNRVVDNVTAMNTHFRILIADKNRHVREFLRRELREAGFRAQVAKDCGEVLMMVDVNEPPHLLVLDLEVPPGNSLQILERMQARVPPLPVIVHAFLAEYVNQPALRHAAALVEKGGNTDRLKTAVLEVLKRHYPENFQDIE
ncbi:MAG: response regulator [Desulfomonile tiedjei]|uniref:Response regulator n=1 Tax=Desulfomonile tiedjei TaxID=2358 RepID=A0A9D6Z7E8_9BACT|nr:response regulator [Desulfomonile tiedjei]